MKYFILLVTFLLCSSAKAQNYKAVRVLGPEKFYLNSYMNMTSMKTRNVKSFILPPNTVKWYYTFSASREQKDIERVQESFSLLSKVSYAFDQSGSSAATLSLIGQPPGSNYCDVYLISNYNNVSPFERKERFYFNRAGSRENFMSGTVEVTEQTSGRQYLGFRNNSSTWGINITVEVVAIVKEEITTNGWTKEQKDALYNGFKKEFKKNGASKYLSDSEESSLIICMLKKFLASHSPEQVQSYAEYEAKEIFMQLAKDCDAELGLKLEERSK